MPVNDTTTNRSYQKPNIANTLADDVGRLRSALDSIDTDMASKAPTAGPTFTGVTTVAAGSAGAPSLTFTGATSDTGLYSPGADQVAISTGGTGRVFVDASGNVGVGGSPSSGQRLVVNGGTIEFDPGTGADSTRAFNFNIGGNNYCKLLIPSGSGGALAFHTGPFGGPVSERMRLTSAGLLGLGTSAPSYELDVAGSGTRTIRVVTTDTTGTAIGRFIAVYTGSGASATSTELRTGDSYGYLATTTNHPLLFGTNGTERFRCDSSGRLLVGTSSARTNAFAGGVAPQVQMEGTNGATSSLLLASNRNDIGQAFLVFGKSRSTSVGGNTSVASGDILGTITFQGADGTNLIEGARIESYVDGTPGTNDMPGRLVFSTTADGASSPTERMRITQDGSVLLNTGGNTIEVTTGTTTGAYYNNSGKQLVLARDGGAPLVVQRRSSDGNIQGFYRDGTLVGTISVTTTATAYNTSSDYRLKENVTPVTDGITRLQQLKPSRFNFIADPAKTVDGFIAHEVQAVVPEAITGEKDAVDGDGNPIYQGIDQSKLVPLLTAALQEAIGEIESLKARVVALESA